MRNKIILSLSFLCMFFLFPIMGNEKVYGQANITNSGDVICPATGSSIQIFPARSSRFSYMLNNINGVAVRIGYLDTGTAALTNATAWVLQPGQAFADSAPNVVSKRVVCMSTTAVANTITFSEAYK